jgi:hypothetical protein
MVKHQLSAEEGQEMNSFGFFFYKKPMQKHMAAMNT